MEFIWIRIVDRIYFDGGLRSLSACFLFVLQMTLSRKMKIVRIVHEFLTNGRYTHVRSNVIIVVPRNASLSTVTTRKLVFPIVVLVVALLLRPL